MVARRFVDEIYALQAQMAKAMGHATRLRILDAIGANEVAYAVLLQRIGVSKANLSQHLGILRASGLLAVRRAGRETYFRLRYPEVKTACAMMRDVLVAHLRANGRQAEALQSAARQRGR